MGGGEVRREERPGFIEVGLNEEMFEKMRQASEEEDKRGRDLEKRRRDQEESRRRGRNSQEGRRARRQRDVGCGIGRKVGRRERAGGCGVSQKGCLASGSWK